MITTSEGTNLGEIHYASYEGFIVTILLGPESSYQGEVNRHYRMYAATPPLTSTQMAKVLEDKMLVLRDIIIDEEGFQPNTKLNGSDKRHSLGLVSYKRESNSSSD